MRLMSSPRIMSLAKGLCQNEGGRLAEQNERTPENCQAESTEWHTIPKKDRSPHRCVAMISDLGTFHPCSNLHRLSQPTDDIEIVPSLLGIAPRGTCTPRETRSISFPSDLSSGQTELFPRPDSVLI